MRAALRGPVGSNARCLVEARLSGSTPAAFGLQSRPLIRCGQGPKGHLSRRTFVSLNDLAKLSPFGSAASKKANNTSAGPSSLSEPEAGGEQYTESVVLPFAQQHLFHVVSDVNAYQEFVPYCAQSRILGPKEGPTQHLSRSLPDGQRQFLAELTVGFGQLQERYTSRVTLIGSHQIIAEAIPTPLFQHLRTSWTLSSVSPTSTRVDFAVQYAFANPFYAAVARTAMQKMAGQMIGAFERRAAEVS